MTDWSDDEDLPVSAMIDESEVVGECCEQCGNSANLTEDTSNGMMYCNECWEQFEREHDADGADYEEHEETRGRGRGSGSGAKKRVERAAPACDFKSRFVLEKRELTEEQCKHIAQMRDNDQPEEDINLLKLLWQQCGWRHFTPLAHQYAGFRFVAGVHESWPATYPPPVPQGRTDGGGILGDEMGLGKTIEVAGGIRISEWIAHRRDPSHTKSTLISAPNDAVLQQWIQVLKDSGVPELQVLRYGGKPPEKKAVDKNGQWPRYVVMTRHTMQRDCSGAMNSFYDRTDTPVADDARWQDGFAYNPSALAPHVTARTAFRLRELYFAKKGVKVNRDEGKEKGVKETQERNWPRTTPPLPSRVRPRFLPRTTRRRSARFCAS